MRCFICTSFYRFTHPLDTLWPVDGYKLNISFYSMYIFSLNMMISFALSMLTSFCFSYRANVVIRQSISPIYQLDHLQNRKHLRLSSSNVYLYDGLPLINDISVINIATNQEVNFLSFIKDITSSDNKKLIILGNHRTISNLKYCYNKIEVQ